MHETVELTQLRQRLEAGTKEAQSSLVAILLLTFALFDIVAALYGDGLVAPAAAAGLRMAEDVSPLPWVVAAIHGLAILAGWLKLSASGLYNGFQPEANLRRSMRKTEPLLPATKAGMVAFAAALLLLALLVPAAPFPPSRAGTLLLFAAVPFCAWAVATLVSRGLEARQRLEDETILRGMGIGAGAVIIASILIDRPGDGLGAASGWFTIVEGVLLCAIPSVILAAALPRQKQIYTLSVDDPYKAPAFVDFDPFRFKMRTPRFLTFSASQGQVVVLTREWNSPLWRLVDVTETHNHLPIHDRTIQVWNLTKLSQLISDEIKVRDVRECFELTLGVGRLTLSSGLEAGAAYERRAVAAANNLLFQNPDLAGLLSRAAAGAFDEKLGDLADRVENLCTFLDRAPTNASLVKGLDLSSAARPVDIAEATFQEGIRAGNEYLDELKQRRQEFREVRKEALASGKALREGWLVELAAEITRAGEGGERGHRVDTNEAIKLLHLIGLRSNRATVIMIGDAAKCEARLETVEAQVTEAVDRASTAYADVFGRETAGADEILKTAIGRGSLRPHEKRTLVAQVIGGRLPGRRRFPLSAPPPPTLPDGEPESDGDDEESLH